MLNATDERISKIAEDLHKIHMKFNWMWTKSNSIGMSSWFVPTEGDLAVQLKNLYEELKNADEGSELQAGRIVMVKNVNDDGFKVYVEMTE